MLTKLLAATDGKKTYFFVIAWAVYQFGLSHGYWPAHPDLETSILTGAGLSLRDSISKP